MKVIITENGKKVFSWELSDKHREEITKKVVKIQKKLDRGLL